MAENQIYLSRMLHDLSAQMTTLSAKVDQQIIKLDEAVNTIGAGIQDPQVIGSTTLHLTEIVPDGTVTQATSLDAHVVGATMRASADGFVTLSGHVDVQAGSTAVYGSGLGYTKDGAWVSVIDWSSVNPPISRDFTIQVPLVSGSVYRLAYRGGYGGSAGTGWRMTWGAVQAGWKLYNVVETGPFTLE